MAQLAQFMIAGYSRSPGNYYIERKGTSIGIQAEFFDVVREQLDSIFADELDAIHQTAEQARSDLRESARVLLLEFTNAIQATQIRAYDQIFDAMKRRRDTPDSEVANAALSTELNHAAISTAQEMAEITFFSEDHIRAGFAVPLRAFESDMDAQQKKFERWLGKHYG